MLFQLLLACPAFILPDSQSMLDLPPCVEENRQRKQRLLKGVSNLYYSSNHTLTYH